MIREESMDGTTKTRPGTKTRTVRTRRKCLGLVIERSRSIASTSSRFVAAGGRSGRAHLHAPPPPCQVRVHTVYVERPSEWTDWTSFGNVTTGIHGHIVVLRQDGKDSSWPVVTLAEGVRVGELRETHAMRRP